MNVMRAKMQVGFVQEHHYGPIGEDGKPTKSQETLHMHAVSAPSYPQDGSDEDNTYARFSPSADLSITIANPVLFGQFKAGDKYYLDFSKAE